jgi:transposase
LESKVSQILTPWAREGSSFALLFEAFSMHLIASEMPVNKVGETLSEYPKRVWTIFNYWLNNVYTPKNNLFSYLGFQFSILNLD